jgi:hypothetical protein
LLRQAEQKGGEPLFSVMFSKQQRDRINLLPKGRNSRRTDHIAHAYPARLAHKSP